MKTKLRFHCLVSDTARIRGSNTRAVRSEAIAALGTLSIALGMLGATFGNDELGNYLSAFGVLLHTTVWLEAWWEGASSP